MASQAAKRAARAIADLRYSRRADRSGIIPPVKGPDGAQSYLRFYGPNVAEELSDVDPAFGTAALVKGDDVQELWKGTFGDLPHSADELVERLDRYGGVYRGQFNSDALPSRAPTATVAHDEATGNLQVYIPQETIFDMEAARRAAAIMGHEGGNRGLPLALDYEETVLNLLEQSGKEWSGQVELVVFNGQGLETHKMTKAVEDFEFPLDRELLMRASPSERRGRWQSMEDVSSPAIQVSETQTREDMEQMVQFLRDQGFTPNEVGQYTRRMAAAAAERLEEVRRLEAVEQGMLQKKVEGMTYEDFDHAYANPNVKDGRLLMVDVEVPQGLPGQGKTLGGLAAEVQSMSMDGKMVSVYKVNHAKNYLPAEMMGQGWGKRLYGIMVKKAHENGYLIASDSSMSDRAGWMYEAMKNRGGVIYDQRVENPDNVYYEWLTWENGRNVKQWYTRDKTPVIRVLKLPKTLPAAFGPMPLLTPEEESFAAQGPYTGFFEDENGTYLFKGQKAFTLPTSKQASVEETAAAALGWNGWHSRDRRVLENISTIGGDTAAWDLLYDTLDRYGFDHILHTEEGDVTYWYEDLAMYRDEPDDYDPTNGSTGSATDANTD